MIKIKLNQSGIINPAVIIIVVIILAVATGLFLVSQRTNLNSRAETPSQNKLTLQSKFLIDNQTTASLVNALVFADPVLKPDMYRLANADSARPNSSTLDWVEYTYPEWASSDRPVSSLWQLDPVPGKKTVLVEFHTSQGWSDRSIATVTLQPPDNPYSLSAQCLPGKTPDQEKLTVRWDSAAISDLQAPFLWLQLYSKGTLIANFPNPDLKSASYTFQTPLPQGNFTLVGIPYIPNDSNKPLDVVKSLGYSEFDGNCDDAALPRNINLRYALDGGYDLTWSGQSGLSAVPQDGILPGFQVYISADPTKKSPFCSDCQVMLVNVGQDKKLHFDDTLAGFSPRPNTPPQTFSKLIPGKKYVLTISSGAYRLGTTVTFTAK